MAEGSWEDRMAARGAVRTAKRQADEAAAAAETRTAALAAGLDPDMPEGHEAHHWHYHANWSTCSCGQLQGGVWSIALDERWWSDDPAEQAAAEREEADWQAWISCWICRAPGVTAADVRWPPTTLTAARLQVRRPV